MNACDPARLERLLVEDISDAERAEAVAHLDGCASCREALEAMAAGGPWWTEARRSFRQSGGPTVTLGGGRASGPSSPGTAGPDEAEYCDSPALGFLRPSETPGHLGRFGPYEVIALLGRGGMGVVLKAYDPALHRLVAIKVLAPQLATSGSARRRFTREARAAASVSHDHVVTIHAVDEADGLPYLVMQYIPGRSLQERIDRDGPLEVKEILRIGMQAASGLAAAHAQGLVHRDVKPANILLENGVERVKLTDFGLARAADDASLTQSGVVAGTPQYMAPEQARGETFDHRADLFSLGSVLYAMATGRAPFRADSAMAVLRRVSDDAPRPIGEVNPEIPGWLEAIVAKLHAKDPAERYQTAAEVADALARRLAELQQPTQARLKPAPAAAPEPARHHAPLVDAAEIPPAKGAPRRSLARLVVLAMVLMMALPAAMVALYMFRSAGPARRVIHGTLDLEVVGDNVEVKVEGGPKLTSYGPGTHHLVQLSHGPHQVWVSRGGVPIQTEVVEIPRGGTVSLRIVPPPPFASMPAAERVATPAGSVVRLEGHEGPVKSVAIAPDGRRAISGSGFPNGDRSARVWDLDSGRELLRLGGGAWTVQGEVTADGRPVGPPSERRAIGTEQVYAVAIAPDGRTALTGGPDRVLRAWDLDTGKQRAWSRSTAGPIEGLAFVPDGRRAVLACADGSVRLWDVATMEEVRRFEGHSRAVQAVAVAPDGRRALSGGFDRALILWDLDSGQSIARMVAPPQGVQGIAIAPDGRRALSANRDETITLWDLETGLPLRKLVGRWGVVECVAFSPDGRRAASGTEDGVVRLWDLESGRELARMEDHRNIVWSVAFTPDGRRILSGGGGVFRDNTWEAGTDFALRLWTPEPATPAPDLAAAPPTIGTVRLLEGHSGPVRAVSASRDGRRALSGSGYPFGDRTLRLWDLDGARELRRIEGDGMNWVLAVALSPDGRQALSGSFDPVVRLWDVETGTILHRFEGHSAQVEGVAFSPEGSRAISGAADGTMRLWSVATGRELHRFDGHAGKVTGVAFLPDGGRALSAGEDRTVRLWDLAGGKELRRFEGHAGKVHIVAVSPDGRRALSAGEDRTVRLWDVETGREIRRFEGHSARVNAVAFSPDGRLALSGSHDRTARLWDVETGRELGRPGGLTEAVWTATFLPDGRALCGGGGTFEGGEWRKGSDFALRLWTPREKPQSPAPAPGRESRWGPARELRRFSGHTDWPTSVAVTRDGTPRILSGGRDRTLRLWDANRGVELRRFDGHTDEVDDVAISADGRLALSGSLDTTARLWDVETGREIRRLAVHPHRKVHAVALSADGTLALTGSEETEPQLWETATGRELCRMSGHDKGITGLAFAPDGRSALSASVDGTARLWSLPDGEQVRVVESGTSWTTSVAFSPDGKRAAVGRGDGSVRIWDLDSRALLRDFDELHDHIHGLAFSPDGRQLLAASSDGKMRAWSVADGDRLGQYDGVGGGVTSLAFFPDGRLVFGCYNAALRLWRLPDASE